MILKPSFRSYLMFCSYLRYTVVASAALAASIAVVSTPLQAQSPSPTLSWSASKQGLFVTALATDCRGRIFAATEGNGLWVQQSGRGWVGYNSKNSDIGDDNITCVAVDGEGRVWAGTSCQGVSVLVNGKWRNYSLLDGPLGERIFDIAVSPVDGDVWMATSAGLARYNSTKKTWSYLTRAEGLPTDQVQALAFDKKGTLYLATQCDGLVIGKANDGYSSWRQVPLAPYDLVFPYVSGNSLPSNLLNDVMVARNGSIWLATTRGLVRSVDNGRTWMYMRGGDYKAKVQDRWKGVPGQLQQPLDWKGEGTTIAEDWVTTVAEDGNGSIWAGHRWETPYDVINPETWQVQYTGHGDTVRGASQPWEDKETRGSNKIYNDYVTSVLPLPNGQVLIGRYSGGLTWSSRRAASYPSSTLMPAALAPSKAKGVAVTADVVNPASATKKTKPVEFPAPAAPPTVAELEKAVAVVKSWKAPVASSYAVSAATSQLPADKPVQAAVYIGEDWRTKGDWVGRYGTRYALLCAMQAPMDHEIVADVSYRVTGDIGPHRLKAEQISDLNGHNLKEDALRHWLHRDDWDDPNVLYNPIIGRRREAEWDDHSEATSNTSEMGSVWASITVPAGIHKVSAYFWNKDGDGGANRYRDYLVEMKGDAPNVAVAEKLPALARTRVRDFKSGSVYKSFLVQGPGTYWMKVGRNFSYNTILQAVFLDKVAGPPTPFENLSSVYVDRQVLQPPGYDEADMQDAFAMKLLKPELLQAARKLWLQLEEDEDAVAGQELTSFQKTLKRSNVRASYQRLAYRAAQASGLKALDAGHFGLLANWRWKLKLWQPEDRTEFVRRMKSTHKALLLKNPDFKRMNM